MIFNNDLHFQSPGELNDLGEMLRECDYNDAGYEADMSTGVTPGHGQVRQIKRKSNKEVAASNWVRFFFGSVSYSVETLSGWNCVDLKKKTFKRM